MLTVRSLIIMLGIELPCFSMLILEFRIVKLRIDNLRLDVAHSTEP